MKSSTEIEARLKIIKSSQEKQKKPLTKFKIPL
jgi:hypothetical protein